MTCGELTHDVLLDYAGWQVAPSERSQIARHLEGCRRCQGRRDELEALGAALRRSADAPPPALLAQLDAAILGDMAKEPVGPVTKGTVPFVPAWMRGPWAAAAVMLLGIVSIVVAVTMAAGSKRIEPVAVTAPPAPTIAPAPPETPREVVTPAPAPEAPKPEAPKPEPAPVVVVPAPPPQPKIPPAPAPAPPKPEPVKPEPAPAVAAPEPPPVPGDLNGDRRVDIADARILQQKLILGEAAPAAADFNGDGVVDIADVRHLTRSEVAAR